MDIDKPYCTPGLRLYQIMMQKERDARLINQERLRGLIRGYKQEIEFFCAHDPVEYERLTGHSQRDPAGVAAGNAGARAGERWQPHFPKA
ncbi:hypothetical protein [Paucimonas lemoignei]|nr:hypothetical protein [Paucimonas lemoignei]